MNLPRPLLRAARPVIVLGMLVVFGSWLDNSGPYQGHAARLLPGFQDTRVLGGFYRPGSVTIAPDGRVFLVLQNGIVRVIENDVLLPDPFIRLDVFESPAQGLFSLALDADFTANGFVYLYYVAPNPRRNRLLRVTAQGNRALPESFYTVWESPPLPDRLNHHGGSPIMDADGLIYFGTGDFTDYINATANSPATPYGKVMRVTREGKPAPGNPFVNVPGALAEVFALGFRNPYNLARDPVSGVILVNDVGENKFEEINQLAAGANYGWDVCEGPCTPPRPDLQDPLLTYAHGNGTDKGCAIVGGVFYRPANVQFPAGYVGNYLYADLCSGWLRALDLRTHTTTVLATALAQIQDIDVAPDGSVYYLVRSSTTDVYNTKSPGQLYRITYTHPQ